jgi:hypothetical protein
VRVVMSTDHLDGLRRRLAGRTGGEGSTNDRVTTERLAAMRRRLSELEHTSANRDDEVEVMAVEEEALEIMDSLRTCGTCGPPRTAEGRLRGDRLMACIGKLLELALICRRMGRQALVGEAA